MARPFVTGPHDVYIGFGPPSLGALNGVTSYPDNFPTPVGPAQAKYYGTTREGPMINVDKSFFEIKSDVSGPQQPLDMGLAGKLHVISLVMSSVTLSVDEQLNNWPDYNSVTNNPGTDSMSDLGTLALSEGLSLGLWLVRRGATRLVNSGAGMKLGWYYMTCIPIGPDQPIEGNKENLQVRVFRAHPNPFAINNNKRPLYRQDNLAFAGLPTPTYG